MSVIRTILGWVLGVFVPGSGRRRVGPAPTSLAAARTCPSSPVARLDVLRLPAHRSPYGLEVPLCGEAVAMVRPYVLEAERERQRDKVRLHRRRVSPVLAADFGADLDLHVVGAEGMSG